MVKTNSYKIRVLQIIYSLSVGGAERVAVNYAKNLNSHKFDTHLCALKTGGFFEKELKRHNIPYHILNKTTSFDLFALIKLAKLIKKHNFDIIHTHGFPANYNGTIAGIICGVKIIIRTEHTLEIRKGISNILRFILRDLLGIFQKKIITVSNGVRKSHVKNKILSCKKHMVLHNGISNPQSPSERELIEYKKQFNINHTCHVVIGIIGSLTTQKGHEVFIKSLNIVRNRGYIFKSIIVGDGPRRSELIKLVKQFNLEDFVLFTGVRRDASKIIHLFDILCLTSNREGFPMVILEAMAAKKPVISTNVGGVSEAIRHNHTGILVPNNSPSKFAESIIFLINNPNIRRQMGKQAYNRYLTNFTLKINIDKIENLYQNIFNNYF